METALPEGNPPLSDLLTLEPESEGDMLSTVATLTNGTAGGAVKKSPPFFKDPAIDWPSALVAWGAAWPLHVYLAAFTYLALTLWALIHVVRVAVAHQLPSKPYYIALNFVIMLCCPARALFLLVDPYGSAKVLKGWQIRLTIAPLFPSITAAFILVFATLMRLTKMQLVSRRLFSPQMIAFIVFINYAIGLTTDILGGLYANINLLILVCECYFIIWGIVASSSYFYVFRRLYIGTVVNRRKLNQLSDEPKTKTTSDGEGGGGKGEKGSGGGGTKKEELTTKMPVAAKITLVAAGCFISISLLHIWRLSTAVTYFLKGWPNANHWQWFMYKTLLRLSELLMCGTILYVGSLPFLSKKRK